MAPAGVDDQPQAHHRGLLPPVSDDQGVPETKEPRHGVHALLDRTRRTDLPNPRPTAKLAAYGRMYTVTDRRPQRTASQ
jgi:hypothetical protein